MTEHGNGNMLIAEAYGRHFMGKPASVRRPSKHLSAEHYEAFLEIASEDELEYDVLLLSTWRLIRENT